ncbi:hypothetical protein JCM11641_008015 [Rhodosporidiobolus odoratus]
MSSSVLHHSSPRSGDADCSNLSASSTDQNSSPLLPDFALSSAASRLPYELLHTIFLLTVTSSSRPPHGGSPKSWYSFESTAPFCLVCKAWRAPAQSLLFSSVALIGHRRASLFLRTALTPALSLADRTTTLVLGVDPGVESSRNGSLGQAETSRLLVSALEACPVAVHLHIRPLSHLIRSRLQAAVFSPARQIRSIILSPRILDSLPWSGQLWLAEDSTMPITSLENLEITTFVVPAERRMGPLTFPTLSLRRLKIHYDYPPEILNEALSQAPLLEFVDLYFERLESAGRMIETLRVSAPNVKDMRYLSNPIHSELEHLAASPPSRPLFDVLLPSFTRLTSLRTSATDISPLSLLSLPPNLQSLHIRSLNVHSRFTCSALLEVLDRKDLVFPEAFRELTVVDAPEMWEREGRDETALEEVRERLGQRGVSFVFKMDFEEEGETDADGSGSGYGTGNGTGNGNGHVHEYGGVTAVESLEEEE